MRLRTIVISGVVALTVSACGSSARQAASLATPPGRIVISALIADGRVELSPVRIGGGPIALTVTNQASRAESLVVATAASGRTVARTAPINPQGTTQIVVDLRPGRYRIATAAVRARTEAARSRRPAPSGATLTVGPRRHGGAGALLTP